MKKKNPYYLGLDIGTDSVGYAVTDEQYNLLRFRGEPAWGVTIFEAGNLKAERRSFRSARRRLDRRQQRVHLLQEIFASEVAKVDERFFIRLKESYKWREDAGDKHIFFNDEKYTDEDYYKDYPTIHHLIKDLMKSTAVHDVRLVYLACAWLVAHRGHFLSNVDVNQLNQIRDVENIYEQFCNHFETRGYVQPFTDVNTIQLGNVLKEKCAVRDKKKKLSEVLLHGQKTSKEITEEMPYSIDALIGLLGGSKVNLKDLFGKEEYADLEDNSITIGMDEEKYLKLMAAIGDDYEIIGCLRALYDWSVLADLLGNNATISEAKVAVYEQHEKDLKTLKYFLHKYAPKQYNAVFRDASDENYVAYSYNTKGLTEEERIKVKKKANVEDFSKFIKKKIANIKPDRDDKAAFEDMQARLDLQTFLPKQKNTDNRVIPYQLYLFELKKMLEQAVQYLPFLQKKQADGLTPAEKILSIFTYKLPYFVGPLNRHSQYAWVERRAEGRILPWNYKELIDFDASEQAFIDKLTNNCTYLGGETVLPKDSLCYQKYMVLNEINNIRINNERISVELKQAIYHDLFEQKRKVTRKQLENYLISNNIIAADERDSITGIDIELKASLSSHYAFRNLLNDGKLSENDVEKIIERASYAEDKSRIRHWLEKNYEYLSPEDIRYICGIKVKDFGRLSRAFLTGLESLVEPSTGEVMTIIGALWQTNYNLMELLSERFSFAAEIKKRNEAYYQEHPMNLEARMDDMYLSNAVRRSIYRTLDIANDVKRAFGAPKKIFIEMTRGEDVSQRGKRTSTRRQQIEQLYQKVKEEDVRELKHELEAMGEYVDNKLQSDKLFLYFMQFGRCAYSGEPIDINRLMAGSDAYNIEHIYPRAFVKDDSIINNKVLVLSKINGEKKDTYPIAAEIREKMTTVWHHWHKLGTISDEKYKRLMRRTPFTDEERYGFINRQLTETSQSTKAVATFLQEKFPETEIVYTKARLTTEFRHKFGLVKSRLYNDLHHAVDAYLNIVTGNVYDGKFSRRWFTLPVDNNYSIKVETLFTRPQYCGKEQLWDGTPMLEKVKRTAMKNNAHFTKYAYYGTGGFFDQMPVKKSAGRVPLKKGLDSEKYGGYNKPSIMFFLPVLYKTGKKQALIVMPVEVMYGKKVLANEKYALEYTFDRLGRLLGKKIDEAAFPLGLRPWKINTVISLDGFRFCIAGNSSGGKCLIMQPVMQFAAGEEWKQYIKKIERFVEKNKKNSRYVYDADYDQVTPEQNLELYDVFVDKLQNSIYGKRINAPMQTLLDGRDKFIVLQNDINAQCMILLNILQIFGRMTAGCDLRPIGGKEHTGATISFSTTMSNWKKKYSDARIIDQSPSGLWEVQSENLLDLL